MNIVECYYIYIPSFYLAASEIVDILNAVNLSRLIQNNPCNNFISEYKCYNFQKSHAVRVSPYIFLGKKLCMTPPIHIWRIIL